MFWIYVLLAIVAGGMVAVQAGVNSQLRSVVESPVLAALISAALTTVLLLLLTALVLRPDLPRREELDASPWWVWSGGVLGGIYLVSAIVLAPRLGAGVLFALIVVGQMLFSLVLDHFGLVGFPRDAISPARVAGALLLVVGAVLVQRG